MLTERAELQQFISIWRKKPPQQVIAEITSYSLETRRIPDPYYFLVTPEGELFSPIARSRVKDIIQKNTYVGLVEDQAFWQIEKWVQSNDEGVVVWISPPHPDIYPTSKMVVSEIKKAGSIKMLFNRAIVLDFDDSQCLRFAQNLAQFSQTPSILSSVEQVRATPIELDVRNSHWIDILTGLITDTNIWQCIRRGDDIRAENETLKCAEKLYRELFEQNSQPADTYAEIFGPYSSSCPVVIDSQTAFGVFYEHCEWFCKRCGACGRIINQVVRPGEKCPAGCGAVRLCR